MGYWVDVQVRTIMISVMYKSKFRMRGITLSRFIIIPFVIFLRGHLRDTRIISLLGSGRDKFDGIGDEL